MNEHIVTRKFLHKLFVDENYANYGSINVSQKMLQ